MKREFLLKPSMWLWKHKWLYYIMLYTWGFPITFFGLLTTLILLPFKRPYKTHTGWGFKIGKGWGGFELGCTFLRDTTSHGSHIDYHEQGHSFQIAFLGVFYIFIIGIPSIIRYWYRRIKKIDNSTYDAIWFESSATIIGYNICFNDKEEK